MPPSYLVQQPLSVQRSCITYTNDISFNTIRTLISFLINQIILVFLQLNIAHWCGNLQFLVPGFTTLKCRPL